MFSTVETHDLSGLLDRVGDLPPFPAVIEQATMLAQDPRTSAADLAKVIQMDPALTAKILRVTNSAFYGMSREISTVKDAVVVMGFSAVRSLAVAMSAMHLLQTVDRPLFRQDVFWLHSMCCAMVAQKISKSARLPADEAFTAGLLHDIGKLVLQKYAARPFATVLAVQAHNGIVSCTTEAKLLRTTHAELGRKLCEKWQLPPSLVAAIGGHHQTTPRQKQSRLAALCAVADYICWHNGTKSVVNEGKPEVARETIETLDAPASAIAQANREYMEFLREARSLIRSISP